MDEMKNQEAAAIYGVRSVTILHLGKNTNRGIGLQDL